MVDPATGEVTFSSDTADGIELDHYELTLSDVTKFIIYHERIPRDNNSIVLGDKFQDRTCSPYNVTVSAFTTLGNSVSNSTMIVTGNNTSKLFQAWYLFVTNNCDNFFTDECSCIAGHGITVIIIIMCIQA